MLRWLGYLLLILIGVAAIVAAVTLLPAHLQIRRVATTFPTLAELDDALAALPAGELPVDLHYVNTASQSTPLGALVHPVVLVRWADGRTLLIDTGMNRTEAQAFGEPLERFLGAEPTVAHGPVEEQLGPVIDTVRGVVFSHLHSDHSSGITDVCAAQTQPATVYQSEAQATLHNRLTAPGQDLIDGSRCAQQRLGDAVLAPIDGFPGVLAIGAAGHTPGSTIYAVRMAGQTWLFIGDITNTFDDLVENRGKGILYSYLLVPENEPTLARWRAWLQAPLARPDIHVVVAHDLESYRRASIPAWPGPADAIGPADRGTPPVPGNPQQARPEGAVTP